MSHQHTPGFGYCEGCDAELAKPAKVSAAERKRRSAAANSLSMASATCRIYNRPDLADQLDALSADVLAFRVDRVEVDW